MSIYPPSDLCLIVITDLGCKDFTKPFLWKAANRRLLYGSKSLL